MAVKVEGCVKKCSVPSGSLRQCMNVVGYQGDAELTEDGTCWFRRTSCFREGACALGQLLFLRFIFQL